MCNMIKLLLRRQVAKVLQSGQELMAHPTYSITHSTSVAWGFSILNLHTFT